MQKRRPDPAIDKEFIRKAWTRILVIAAAVIVVDQLTKSWAENRLGANHIIHVVGSLQLALVRNTGVAFGIGAGVAPLLIAIAIIGFVLVLFGRHIWLQGWALIGVGLVLGGALSNVVDRIARNDGGAVVDFIDLGWWPVFNIADACIVVGAAMLVLWGSKKSPQETDSE
jgi:signal peptidase II